MRRYTFSMKGMLWIIVVAALAVLAWSLWRARARMAERRQAEEARAATLLAQAIKRPGAAPANPPPEAKLLLEAAVKAGEAGEPALAIQLYARLLARFPQSPLLAQAHAGIGAQRARLDTARAPGTSGPG
jgi:hypothetical protein